MSGLRDNIASSVKPFTPSVRAVANLVGLGTPPISGRRVLNFTEPVLSVSSGPLHAQTVQAFGALALHPSGKYAFVGHAHENGVVGDIYAMSCAINVLDDQGRALALQPHEKKLSGTADPFGDRTDNFQIVGFDQRIRDRWPEVKAARKTFTLHAATDPFQVVEVITEALVAAAGVTGLVFLGIAVIPLIPVPHFSIVPLPEGGLLFRFCWGLCPPLDFPD